MKSPQALPGSPKPATRYSGSISLSSKKRMKTSRSRVRWVTSVSVSPSRFGIVIFENVSERVTMPVQFFQERLVNGLVAAPDNSRLRRAALFGQGFGEFFKRAARNGLAGKQPVNFRKSLFVWVLAVMELFKVALQRGFQVGLEPAVHNLELRKIKEDGDGRLAVPAVAGRLKVIVHGGDVPIGLFGFDVEFHVAEIWGEIKGIIGAALGNAVFLALDFDLLFVGVFLGVVVDVPAESD